jgi:hypothetical protein
MKSAGATEKDINTAVLTFKRQESLFQTQLKGHSSAFSDEHERIHMLKAKAQRELALVCLSLHPCACMCICTYLCLMATLALLLVHELFLSHPRACSLCSALLVCKCIGKDRVLCLKW